MIAESSGYLLNLLPNTGLQLKERRCR